MITRYNKLTQDEFLLLKGTEKIANMIGNKFKTHDFDVVEFLEQNSMGQFCVIKQELDKSWLIYFESSVTNLDDKDICDKRKKILTPQRKQNSVLQRKIT